jgi:DNA repair protein RecO (recombination protein O)
VIENATGIILRTRPLSDTSLIVNWLTPELGRISTVAKGARRPQSPFRGKLDLFYSGDFSFARSRRSELHTLREVSVKETRVAIRQDLKRLEMASYVTTLIEQATETETPLPEVYRLTCDFLEVISTGQTSVQLIYALELKLLNELGLSPELEEAKLSPGAKEIARHLLERDFEFCARIQLTRAQANEFRQYLHGFLIYHLGKAPKNRAAATEQ